MGLSCRNFLLDRTDTLYRLPGAAFERMMRNTSSHPLTAFAGQRLRLASVAVLLQDRRPIHVVHTTFSVLTFDAQGLLDRGAFERQQRARVERAVAPVLGSPPHRANIVDAAPRFIEQGGSWTPTASIAKLIERAALERIKCPPV
jgi:hypothetical protein